MKDRARFEAAAERTAKQATALVIAFENPAEFAMFMSSMARAFALVYLGTPADALLEEPDAQAIDAIAKRMVARALAARTVQS